MNFLTEELHCEKNPKMKTFMFQLYKSHEFRDIRGYKNKFKLMFEKVTLKSSSYFPTL